MANEQKRYLFDKVGFISRLEQSLGKWNLAIMVRVLPLSREVEFLDEEAEDETEAGKKHL